MKVFYDVKCEIVHDLFNVNCNIVHDLRESMITSYDVSRLKQNCVKCKIVYDLSESMIVYHDVSRLNQNCVKCKADQNESMKACQNWTKQNENVMWLNVHENIDKSVDCQRSKLSMSLHFNDGVDMISESMTTSVDKQKWNQLGRGKTMVTGLNKSELMIGRASNSDILNINGRDSSPDVQKGQCNDKPGCDLYAVKCSNRFDYLQNYDDGNDPIGGVPTAGRDNLIEGTQKIVNHDPVDGSLVAERSHKPKQTELNKQGNKLTLKAALFNAQSLNTKIPEVSEYIKEQNLDLYMIVESWFCDKNARNINNLKQGGFEMRHTPRLQRKGGGISVIFRKNLEVSKVKSPPVKTCELMEILVKNKVKKLRFVIIYRPEPDPKNPAYTMTEFYEEFTSLLAHYMTYKEEVIFCGDYNFHVNNPEDVKANKFKEILDTFELVQHVKESTHREGNTLDLIITKSKSSILSHTVDLMLSDHCNILMDVDMRKPPLIKKELTFRKTRSIDKNNFKADMKSTMENIILNDNLQDMVSLYNDKLTEIFDKHAPEQTKTITVRKHTPWTTEEIKPEKQTLRKLERKMKRTKLEIDKQNFKTQKLKYKKILDDKRTEHYSNLIEENCNDPKGLFKVINKALNKKEDTAFPPGVSDNELANEFLDFFDGKIERIRTELDGPNNETKPTEVHKYQYELNDFRLLTEDEVRKLMVNSGNKYCELDPMPTSLLKDCIDDVLPLITQIINLSLSLGDMPQPLKKAIIKPLLKKLGLELEKKNYRPVSNLAFISKLIEKAVAFQLIDHLKRNNLYDKFQSAYRQFHSTETALLRVKNDVLNAMDNQNITLMLLLDLSAAFDTIDHEILLHRLKERCGIGGTAIKWMRSYLTDRTQIVKINNSISEVKPLKYGVPQGSVLGPILFTIYTAPLGEIIEESGLKRQIFADDTGIYHSISPTDSKAQEDTLGKIENGIAKIKDFLIKNKLKINDDKTVFMLLGTKYWISKLKFNNISIGQTVIESTDNTKNLGIIFDTEMNLHKHINYICKRGYYHVRDLFELRKFLSETDTKTAAHAFVTSIMDYGNSLLYGASVASIEKLQVLQNTAVRAVRKKRKLDHISEDRFEIHWLPVEARIKFKILLMTWKCIHNRAPIYLQELLKIVPGHRTQYKNMLTIPKVNNKTHGDIAFGKAAPVLWNALPNELRDINTIEKFKKHLKTHLFKLYMRETHLRRN